MIDYKNPNYTEIFASRAEKLNKIRSTPDAIPKLLAYYKTNPAQMINDWGCTFDPRNIERGLPAIIPFILFPRQQEWIKWCMMHWKEQDPAPTVKSRDMGLSWLSVALACSLSITHNNLVIGFGSRKEEYVDKIGSPKSLFYKARMFMALLPYEIRSGFISGVTDPHMRLKFPHTGSTIVGESGDGIGRGDRASIYFVDEAAFLERPQLVEASLSQTTNCRIDISTPNGLANPFAERVNSGKFDTFIFHWRDDPRKDDEWYAKQKRILDPMTVAQEIDINFSASVDGVLIPSEWVQSAIDAHLKLDFDPTGERTTSLDIADLGRDSNAHVLRDGIMIRDVRQWHGKTTDDIYGTTQKAFDHCDEWKAHNIIYDSDGVGAGARGDARVINAQRKKTGEKIIKFTAFHGGAQVIDKERDYVEGRTNGDFFENLKAQSWWSLRERFKLTHEAVTQGKEFNPDDLIIISSECSMLPQLQTELSQPTYSKTSRGKIIINKAPNGTKSPNVSDSVNMVYAPIKKKLKYTNIM